MTCTELPELTRLEGAKIHVLIVARVSEKTIDVREFDFKLTMLLIQYTDLNCDSVLAKASTKVFLGDKMCTFLSRNFIYQFNSSDFITCNNSTKLKLYDVFRNHFNF